MIPAKTTWRHAAALKAAQTRARNRRIRNFRRVILFVIATLVAGLSFNKISQWLKVAGLAHDLISKTTFYRRQKEIGKKIIQLCDKKMKEEREKIDNNTVIGIDGSWDHRRNGQWCIVDGIDTGTGKIIYYSLISKKDYENPFVNASNQMEKEGVSRQIGRASCRERVYVLV
jgi:hypothetical protein